MSRRARTAALAAIAALLALAGPAGAQTTTYTSTETIPVPPASNYAGTGGGDGWDVSMSPTEVFNVFHHQGSFNVACHKQADASACYPNRTITDGDGKNFGTSNHSGTYLDAEQRQAVRVRHPRRQHRGRGVRRHDGGGHQPEPVLRLHGADRGRREQHSGHQPPDEGREQAVRVQLRQWGADGGPQPAAVLRPRHDRRVRAASRTPSTSAPATSASASRRRPRRSGTRC